MSLTRAYLEIVDGPGKGGRVLLRDGQVGYVGRTSQADFSFPENVTMSSVHFSVRWHGEQCELKDLNSANGTWRNGKKIAESLLAPGDEFKAGRSTFRLLLDAGGETRLGETTEEFVRGDTNVERPQPQPITAAAPAADSLRAMGLVAASAAALPPQAQLSDEGKAMLVDDMPVTQFLELLASREQYLDALRVVGHALAKRAAIAWSCRCVRAGCSGDLSPADEAALTAAEAWVADPNEEHRRRAQAVAEGMESKSAASWTAMAAFFSAGSLAPPTAPVVPPADHLTAHAAVGAAMLAAVARQPEKAAEKYQLFLQLGRELMANGATP